jgi:hypothetical protein
MFSMHRDEGISFYAWMGQPWSCYELTHKQRQHTFSIYKLKVASLCREGLPNAAQKFRASLA